MKDKIMIYIGIVILLLSLFLISCENPWLIDILGKQDRDAKEGRGGADDTPAPIAGFEWIRPGTFNMGSPDTEIGSYLDEAQHQVKLTKGFYMAKYAVTQEKYQTVMGSNPSYFNNNPASGEDQGKRPVEQVSWYDVIVFCNKLSIEEGLTPVYTISGTTNPDGWGTIPTTSTDATWDAVTMNSTVNGYRLPTEAEWEYACRGGTTTAYSYGNTANPDYMWYDVNSVSMTHEVGKKTANAWGLYDKHGNVFEWCWDWYDDYGGAVTDYKGPGTLNMSYGAYRVSRGGCWGSPGQDARSGFRNLDEPWGWYYNVGFRLVRQ
ncbi:MAG: formylglycine-generating enzyme family protein [Spirochaetaceae bacterium]|nr:formylglycine-generating enzyme family protein [Spirochaetaceae bacterium]